MRSDSVSKKVTVVTGYYNRENNVDESIKSLINQDYSNLEIIIFDDASTDNTYQKLKFYESRYSQLKVIRHVDNIGFTKGIINAIKLSNADYIAIHGSGDISQPSRISEQVRILNTYKDVGVVGCTVKNIQLNEKKEPLKENELFTKKFHGSFKKDILKNTPFTHGEAMFRRNLYNKVGGYRPQFKFSLDRDLWCRMSRLCNFYTIPKNLYTRYLLPDGVGTKIEKLFLQRLLSEFARQCHEEALNGRMDYVEKYGDQGFFFMKYNKRISREFLKICHKRAKYGRYADAQFIAKFIFSKTINFHSVKGYLKYILLAKLYKSKYKKLSKS